MVFSLAIESKKTDEQMKKTDEQMKNTSKDITRISQEMKTLQQETQKEIKDLGLYIGNIARNQGDIAEEFFVNSISSIIEEECSLAWLGSGAGLSLGSAFIMISLVLSEKSSWIK